jgi:predicted metal-dependent HD superfamily phosphohydrolase
LINLKTIWNKLASRYTDNIDLVDKLWNEIEKQYSKGKRHYHNLEHLKYMMEKAIKYKDSLNDLDTVMFAIFYHDIVYDTTRHDNEKKSADLAHDRLVKLGFPADKEVKCQGQIMATKEHKESEDNDTSYLLDFDLAILGDTPECYRNYAEMIRAEYSIYPNFLYKKGRQKVLQHILSQKRIFKTQAFYDHYEHQARANVRSELEGL